MKRTVVLLSTIAGLVCAAPAVAEEVAAPFEPVLNMPLQLQSPAAPDEEIVVTGHWSATGLPERWEGGSGSRFVLLEERDPSESTVRREAWYSFQSLGDGANLQVGGMALSPPEEVRGPTRPRSVRAYGLRYVSNVDVFGWLFGD